MILRAATAFFLAIVASAISSAALAESYPVGEGSPLSEGYRLERLIYRGELNELVYLDKDSVDLARVIMVTALTPDGEAALRFLSLDSENTRALIASIFAQQEKGRALRIEQNSRFSGKVKSYAECAFWTDLPCSKHFFPTEQPKISTELADSMIASTSADLESIRQTLLSSDPQIARAWALRRSINAHPNCSWSHFARGHVFDDCEPSPKYFQVRLGIDYAVAY